MSGFYAALERDAVERAAFLETACDGDEALRREVESLLVYQAKSNDFIEAPHASAHLGLLSRVLTSVRDQHVPAAAGRFAGRTLGVYEVKALIGAGGMGEVYRAVDSRLNRTVAIKVLPEAVSTDPARRERFNREARIISTLNHPHICALYDVGSQDGVDYLVMEHIDGETLQARLEQGALSVPRALEYAIQICDALDKAHRRGVTHRDLKPANVMLTKSGVKLLDFGAATFDAVADETSPEIPDDAASEETSGMILGTLQYMSPEQLEGKQADGRTDIFAFGAVLYEMITGEKALRAASPVGLIGAILKDEAQPVAELAPQIPPSLARAISRCLSKDPDERWQTANDLLFQLRSISMSSPGETRESRPRRLVIERAVWAAAVLGSIFITLVWARSREVRPVDSGSTTAAIRFNIVPADGIELHAGYGVPFALSPDGSQIVFVGDSGTGTRQLWLRSLSSDQQQPLPGTEGANTPFWSPDSQWIGFFADRSLKKVRVSSGLTQIIATEVTSYGGAAWNAGDVILFPAGPGGLSRVSAQGGALSQVTTGEGSHFWPQFLADGAHFIYAAARSASLDIGSLEGEAPRSLMKFPVRVSSLAYVPGYVFFVQDDSLFAQAFDETRLELSGEAIQIADGIPVTGPGRASFSVSASGVLAYWPYPVGTAALLRWFDREGRTSTLVDAPAQYVGFSLSPDDQQLVFSRLTRTGGADVWIRDLVRGGEKQLTFDGAAFTPQWSPDGMRIVFSGPGQQPPPKLFVKNVAGTAAAVRIGDSEIPSLASSWSADGQSIVSVRIDPATRNDLWVERVHGKGEERLAFNSSFNESGGKVSSDGRWIAYTTDESGTEEVWVASFPAGTIRRQVSQRGGTSPQWSKNGNELYFISDDKQLVAVQFGGAGSDVELGAPQVLFPVKDLAESDQLLFPTANAYVSAANGKRFLVAVRAQNPDAPPISVVVNWRGLLKR